ncbi:MAG: phospholipase [Ruminococcaceae bacterium]|nr:phospholipase [Oscillospiraceae bacterium]
MKKIMHVADGTVFSYIEYIPENFDETKKYPLVVQLHGAGERGDGKDDLHLVEVHGFSKLFAKQEHDFECITVMPQCPKDTFWAARVESVCKFIDEIIARRPIDEKKIYLTGLSMGGYGTWYTAMAYPWKFAAIAPVCGGGMAWNAGVLDMPIRVFHGAEDNLVDVRNSDEMVDKLKFLGKDVEYSRLDGVMHNAWDRTYDTELMEWFLSKSL